MKSHILNSTDQFTITDVDTTTRCEPHTFSERYPSKKTDHLNGFSNTISSDNMPFKLFL